MRVTKPQTAKGQSHTGEKRFDWKKNGINVAYAVFAAGCLAITAAMVYFALYVH